MRVVRLEQRTPYEVITSRACVARMIPPPKIVDEWSDENWTDRRFDRLAVRPQCDEASRLSGHDLAGLLGPTSPRRKEPDPGRRFVWPMTSARRTASGTTWRH